jgi:glucose-1-phosphate adenylyltransferase
MGKAMALILAGGKGQRMDILCRVRPKPVLPFGGKFRVIDFTLSNCVHSGLDKIALLTDHQRSYMASYIKRWNHSNGHGERACTLEPASTPYKGTADAVYQNLAYVKKQGIDKVVILAGDHVYKMDYRKMIAFHDRANADLTVGVLQVPWEQASRFGTLNVAADNRVMRFVEKSEMPESNLASMGIYVFNIDVLI